MRVAVAFGGVLAMAAAARADVGRTASVASTGICELRGLDEKTAELLGRPAIVANGTAKLGIYTVEEVGGGITATLTFSDEEGVARTTRTFSGTNCEEVVDSLAVLISVLMRLEPEPPRAEVTSPELPARRALPVLQVAHADIVARPRRPEMPSTFELAATIGTAGEHALVLGATRGRARHSLGGELRVHAPETTVVSDIGTVHVFTATLGAIACVRRGGFAACATSRVGVTRGEGEDLIDAHSDVNPIVGVGARLEWRQELGRHTGVRLFVDVEQLLVSTRFLVDDMPVWASPWLQAWLGGGIYFHAP